MILTLDVACHANIDATFCPYQSRQCQYSDLTTREGNGRNGSPSFLAPSDISGGEKSYSPTPVQEGNPPPAHANRNGGGTLPAHLLLLLLMKMGDLPSYCLHCHCLWHNMASDVGAQTLALCRTPVWGVELEQATRQGQPWCSSLEASDQAQVSKRELQQDIAMTIRACVRADAREEGHVLAPLQATFAWLLLLGCLLFGHLLPVRSS